MKALITGASSGIGREFAKVLSDMGYELFIVARREERLLELAETLKTKTTCIYLDISTYQGCNELYEKTRNENIDILINNAGFGAYGEFSSLNLEKELSMIDLNCKSLHTLTKLFLKDFIERDNGYILNVASSAGLMPGGPLMATYYATKSYVINLTNSIYIELKQSKSNVHICSLCPGPVDTEFDEIANVKFSVSGLSAEYVAKYSIKKMFKNKMIIIPGAMMKIGTFFSNFIPKKILLKFTLNFQTKKNNPT